MSCKTCNGSGKVREDSFAASSYMNSAGMGLRVCPACGGSGKAPGNEVTGAFGGQARAGGGGFYDTLVNFECFVIGVIAAILLWQLHYAAGIAGLIAGWVGGLMLFAALPRTFTGVFTLIWVLIAIAIVGNLSGGSWMWTLFAAVVAGIGSFSAHMRTLRSLSENQ